MREFTIKCRRIRYEDGDEYISVTPKFDIGRFNVDGFFSKLDTYPLETVLSFLDHAIGYHRTYLDKFKPPKGRVGDGIRRTLGLMEAVYRELKP